jgi:hypothetical protein
LACLKSTVIQKSKWQQVQFIKQVFVSGQKQAVTEKRSKKRRVNNLLSLEE